MYHSVGSSFSKPRIRAHLGTGIVAAASFVALSGGAARFATATDLVSGHCNAPPDAASGGPAVNADGSVIAFYSDATNLVGGDTNRHRDVFVTDVSAGTTERVSVSSTGAQANGASYASGGAPSISADGQVIAFYSIATNLVADDTNGAADVFVRDRAAGTTQRVSLSSSGEQGNGPSLFPSISGDGNLVAFQSLASNLVLDDTNAVADIFVHDRRTGTTERVCGVQGNDFSFTPVISADGNFVAFASAATNLVPNDTNGKIDVFVCDRAANTLTRVSLATDGTQGNDDSILPAISCEGGIVAFKSLASNLGAHDNNRLVDVFVHELGTGATQRINMSTRSGDADDVSFPPALCDAGRFVAFGSFATNLSFPDTNRTSDVFVRDRLLGVTRLATNDIQANQGTVDAPPSLSCDCSVVAFVTASTNLGCPVEFPSIFVVANPFEVPPTPTGTRPTETATATAHATEPVTPTASGTSAATTTASPTQTAIVSPTLPTGTTTATITPTAPATDTTTPTTTAVAATATVTAAATATASPAATATNTPTMAQTGVATDTATMTAIAATATTTATAIASPPTATASAGATASPTPISSVTAAETPTTATTATAVETSTPTSTPTDTPTDTTEPPTQTPILTPFSAALACVGACGSERMVHIEDLVMGVNIAMGAAPVAACGSLDRDHNGSVTIDELIEAVHNALSGCPTL